MHKVSHKREMHQKTRICVALKDIETRSDVVSCLVLASGPAIK